MSKPRNRRSRRKEVVKEVDRGGGGVEEVEEWEDGGGVRFSGTRFGILFRARALGKGLEGYFRSGGAASDGSSPASGIMAVPTAYARAPRGLQTEEMALLPPKCCWNWFCSCASQNYRLFIFIYLFLIFLRGEVFIFLLPLVTMNPIRIFYLNDYQSTTS